MTDDEGATIDRQRAASAIEGAIAGVDDLTEQYVDAFPIWEESPTAYGTSDGRSAGEWTAGFWPGLLWIAHEQTGDDRFRRIAEGLLDRFAERLREGDPSENHHDLGFLFTPSALAAANVVGSGRGQDLAVEAADRLAARWHAAPEVIQAWGDYRRPGEEVRIIVDTMLNLPLLFRVASVTGNERYRRIAASHADRTADTLVGDGGKTTQRFWFDVDTGEPLRGVTAMDDAPASCWSRGQSWAIYGFALAHRHTGRDRFLEVARSTAEYYLDRVPTDLVPPSHFEVPDRVSGVGTSAAAIAASGFLEIANALPPLDPERRRFEDLAFRTLESLTTDYAAPRDADGLLAGTYAGQVDGEVCTPWGDYFYLEALVRATRDWTPYWAR